MSTDVTIIIPTYNRCHLVREAIQSCIKQGDSLRLEVVVVDDGSTDGTRNYLKSLDDARVTPVFQEHRGAQVARNRGYEQSSGQYVKFLDDDDVLVPGALAKEVNALEDSGADLCIGNLLIDDNNDTRFTHKQQPDPDLICGILLGTAWTIPAGLTYRSASIRSCTWDPDVEADQDAQFAGLCAARNDRFVHLEETVAINRSHDGDRISDRKTRANARDPVMRGLKLVDTVLGELNKREALQLHHRQAAAKRLWRLAHMAAAFDLSLFRSLYRRTLRLNPAFRPSREFPFSWLDRLGGPWITEHLFYPARRLKLVLQKVKTL